MQRWHHVGTGSAGNLSVLLLLYIILNQDNGFKLDGYVTMAAAVRHKIVLLLYSIS